MRKRWTPKTEITDALLLFREKKKWQIALRRYVLEKNKSSYYAPFFGLDSSSLRKWIELQFEEEQNWSNFSTAWQLDHLLPIAYFDYNDENDLRLCWNFVNISVEKANSLEKKDLGTGILSAKSYFASLYQHTGYAICLKLVEKINLIETQGQQSNNQQVRFIIENKNLIESLSILDSSDYDKLNGGIPLAEIQALKNLLNKFGQSL